MTAEDWSAGTKKAGVSVHRGLHMIRLDTTRALITCLFLEHLQEIFYMHWHQENREYLLISIMFKITLLISLLERNTFLFSAAGCVFVFDAPWRPHSHKFSLLYHVVSLQRSSYKRISFTRAEEGAGGVITPSHYMHTHNLMLKYLPMVYRCILGGPAIPNDQ